MLTDKDGLLFESDHLEVIYRPAGGQLLVYSFNEMGFQADGSDFWGRDFFAKAGISVVGIVSRAPNWFPAADMRAAAAAIHAAIPAEAYYRRVGYGFSMGGYGALKFGALLRADAALALSPQVSIDPADLCGGDLRYTKYFDPALHPGMAVREADLPAESFVFYDPLLAEDRLHVGRLAGMRGIAPIAMPFSDHHTIVMLTEARIARTLLYRAVNPDAGPAAMRNLIRINRTGSRAYWKGRRDYLQRKAPLHAAALAVARDRAASLRPPIPTDLTHDIFLHEWQKRMTSFDFELAADLARAMLARDPADNFARIHLIRNLLDSGDVPGAALEIDAATAVPGATAWDWRHLEDFNRRIGREGEAAAAHERLVALESGSRSERAA